MNRTGKTMIHLLAAGVLAAGTTSPAWAADDDAGHGNDYRTFHQNGTIDYGEIGDSFTADLVLYLAGNQFMVMEELIKDFLSKHPGIDTVYVETIPPGQILKQIMAGGEIDGQKTAQNPDVYASVNLGHLVKLKGEGQMQDYMIYTRNKLELMVAKGNPKNIRGIADLARSDVRTSMPNPVNEGIMQFYGRKVLERHGLWQQISGGKECLSCQTTPYFSCWSSSGSYPSCT
jgi:hypothetical protein